MGDISLRGRGKAYLASTKTSTREKFAEGGKPDPAARQKDLARQQDRQEEKSFFFKKIKEAVEIPKRLKKQRLKELDAELGIKREEKAKGGSIKKDTHITKDGRVAKKGLYYYMNRAKKLGKSKPGKGTVSDKALKASAKTAKK